MLVKTLSQDKNKYFCIVCNRNLPIVDGVIIHDNIEHPEAMVFEPEARAHYNQPLEPTNTTELKTKTE